VTVSGPSTSNGSPFSMIFTRKRAIHFSSHSQS
jgi:hypothetical protein